MRSSFLGQRLNGHRRNQHTTNQANNNEAVGSDDTIEQALHESAIPRFRFNFLDR
jgi:hypothetical protein